MAITLPVCMKKMKESAQTFFIELYTIELRTGTIYLAACDEDIVTMVINIWPYQFKENQLFVLWII